MAERCQRTGRIRHQPAGLPHGQAQDGVRRDGDRARLDVVGEACGDDHWHYDFKLAFFDALTEQTRQWLRDEAHLIVAGDVNVAATDSDVFHPDAFVDSVYVTKRERDALARLLDTGLVDVDVARWGPRARRFTWWNHGIGYERNLGMRLDMIATDRRLAARLDTTWIDHAERSTTPPSDHAAVIADFHLTAHR